MKPDCVDQLTQSIVEVIHPERVILFGSRARGDASELSDFDFAVEGGSKNLKQWNDLLESMENQYITLLPVDLVRLEEAGFELKRRILLEGQVIYDRLAT